MLGEHASALMTAEELERVDIPGKCTELVRGRLVVHEPPGSYHAQVTARLVWILGNWVIPNGLGTLFAEGGFQLERDPDTVRAPDVAFIARDRLEATHQRGFGRIVPDLVVEIRSPNDRRSELLAKVGDWLDAGVKLVWVIDPIRRECHVHRGDGSLAVVPPDGSLDGEDVLPGLTCPLASVFEQ
jgi:Uma2 family endonuclease